MSKVKTLTPVGAISKKLSKTDDVYFKTRKTDQAVFAVRVKNPYWCENPTEKQLSVQAKMRAVREALNAEMSTEEGKKALRAQYEKVKGRKNPTFMGWAMRQKYAELYPKE